MASLKNIMNAEDDQVDQVESTSIQRPRGSASRPFQPSNSTVSNSSYATAGGQSTSSSVYNNQLGSPGQSSRSLVPEALPTDSSAQGQFQRRRSNNGTDSMDSPYGYNLPNSSTMRPLTSRRSSGSSGEPHVKLTPITKRISKAKKGQPVHVCENCTPPKTFTRAEHLRRHQLSHQPPELACQWPGCDKAFYRKDLLERHHQRHELDELSSREGSQSSPRPRNSRTPGQPYETPSRESGLQMPRGYMGSGSSLSPNLSSHSAIDSSGWQPMSNDSSITRPQISSPQVPDVSEDYSMGGVERSYIIGPPITDLQASTETFAPGFSEPRGMSNVAGLYVPDAGPAGLWPDSSAMPSSASESTYSTPPDSTHRISLRASGDWSNTQLSPYAAASRDAHSPPMDGGAYSSIPYSYATSPPQFQTMYAGGLGIPMIYPEESTLYGPDTIPATTVRSLSPQLAVAQSSESLVTLPPSLSSDPLVDIPLCGRQQPDMFNLLTARDLMPVSLSRAARDSIPAYLDVYWDKVDPQSPIIHKPTFAETTEGTEEHSHVLRCAMAAVATQFMADKEHRIKGEQLHAYAHYKSKLFTQSDNWTLPVMQTVLLCDYYARFRGKKKESYRPSPRFAPLYQRALHYYTAFPSIPTASDSPAQWKTWIEWESRRRLLAACFLLDVHSARYHEQPFASIVGLDYSCPSTLPIPLSNDTAQLWGAQDSDAWAALSRNKYSKGLNNIHLQTLTPSDIASVPPFDAAILLAAYTLHHPRRQDFLVANQVEAVQSIQIKNMHIANLFSTSQIANTYLALHYTPLHFLLSVSGDSWVFNKKVMPISSFTEHQKRLGQWQNSESAAVATVFAARALKAFFNLKAGALAGENSGDSTSLEHGASWTDISDYWGVYVCVLICWAFGHTGKRQKAATTPSTDAAMKWIVSVAEMEPGQVLGWTGRAEAHGVIGFARRELAKDCIGGRNMLFADAVRVLEKLEQGGNWKWF